MMTTTQCPPQPILRDYTCGRLADDESHEVFEHLRHCSECQSQLETIDDSGDSLIVDLRSDDPHARFSDEPQCKIALAKALAALAKAGEVEGESLSPMDLPQEIGGYEIVSQIGRGGMGRVYLARHLKLGRQVALKVIANHRLIDTVTRERFDAEMQAVGRLSHPNIVTAYDAREVDGLAVLVTEFIDGKNLQELVQQTGPLSLADAADVVTKVAAALQYTWEQGFVHRDVKPSNIMMSRSGEVKLLDLGLARFQQGGVELTASGQTIGTADYIAPEQVTDGRNSDTRSDVYSLGCTLFKLLTGNAPFETSQNSTTFAKLTAHVSTPAPSLQKALPSCPVEVAKLIDSMLEKSPEHRPQQPRDIVRALSRYATGSDLKTLVERSGQPIHRTQPQELKAPALQQSWFRRPVPRVFAIASGLLGAAAGFAMGIFIEITYPDGTVVKVPLSNGATMKVVDEEKKEEEAPKGDGAGMPAEANPLGAPNKLPPGLHAMAAALAAQTTEKLQGIWQITLPDRSSPASKRVAMISFDGFNFRSVTLGGSVEQFTFGRFATQLDDKGLFLLLSFSPREGNTLGTLSFSPDGKNALFTIQHSSNPLPIFGYSGADIAQPHKVSFQYLGKQPTNDSDFQAMIGDREIDPEDPYVKAIVALARDRVRGLLAIENEVRHVGQQIHLAKSQNNLKEIGLAFFNFESSYGKFPGSENTHNPKGQDKIHPCSWRVAILPWIGEEKLHNEYRFDEPWDSEHNLALVERMPEIYRTPRAPKDQPKGHTNYMGFSSEGALLHPKGGVVFREVRDGTSNTILVVESKKSVPWTKPEDLEEIPEFFSPTVYSTADGAVHTKEKLDLELLKKMITFAGGEPL